MRKILYLSIIAVIVGCTKEIDFEYNEMTPLVVIEGQVTNEGTRVMVTQTRSVYDREKSRCLPGAVVTVSTSNVTTPIPYDATAGCYRSPLVGEPGLSYHLRVELDGKTYESTSTMPYPSKVLSALFFWQSVIDERLLVYELWATDPEPSERNYYWYRVDRLTHHPHFDGKDMSEAYLWGAFDDRGNPPGLVYRDVMCMSERMADEDEEENWKRILYEGDSLTCQLMNIDQGVHEYLTSLRAGQGGGANPKTNISGGCQGYFAAMSIAHADTIVYRHEEIREFEDFADYWKQWSGTK